MRGPGHGMTRKVVCAGAQSINYLGPVVKPRDDKEGTQGPGYGMTSFFLTFLFSKNNYKMKNNHKVN